MSPGLPKLREIRGSSDAGEIAGRLGAALAEPFPVEGGQVTIGASIGVALAGGLEVRPDELIARADRAMYIARQEGTTWRLDP